jgi:hypothetical protein
MQSSGALCSGRPLSSRAAPHPLLLLLLLQLLLQQRRLSQQSSRTRASRTQRYWGPHRTQWRKR